MKHGVLFFAVSGLFISSPSVAAFKCVDADGSVSFSQTPCAGSGTSSQINVGGGGAKFEPRACELAGLFAEDAAKRMRSGSDYSREIGRYGGTHGARPALVGVVNYIYSFVRADDIPEMRIASLTRAKCQSGGFGRMAFDDLPVDEYYVYDGNSQSWVRKGEMGGTPSQPAQKNQGGTGYPPGISPNQNGAMYDPTSSEVDDSKSKQECESVKAALGEIDARMRSGYRSEESNDLEEKRRQIRDKVWKSCK